MPTSSSPTASASGVCRELSPILVSVLVAGRSGAAFTAQIGTMKVEEEIDAISTLGLSPLQVLVIPRLVALVVALPLLVFVGDVAGITGGMLVGAWQLDIAPQVFLDRVHGVLEMRHVVVGLVKAPVFAAFIAVIACRMGLLVARDARSVGENTTSTVVQCIVWVILLDAVFAVVFQHLEDLMERRRERRVDRHPLRRAGGARRRELRASSAARWSALIGGSGSGKSVLLKEIIGLVRPTAGRIELLGTDVWRCGEQELNALRRRFGVLFQDGALFSSLTVAENVAVPFRENTALPMDLIAPLVGFKLALVGLPADAAVKSPAQLSGGMRKRVALARALALEPEILFLDEPTSGLDPVGAREFDRLLRVLADSLGLTVFIVTHDVDLLASVADRAIALVGGQGDRRRPGERREERRRSLAARILRGPRLMEPEAKYTLVGVAVLILLALVAAAVVWLRSSGEGADAREYKIYFERQSLEGLEPRSNVTMRGVRVGSVTGLRFSSQRPGRGRSLHRVDPATPVRKARARPSNGTW